MKKMLIILSLAISSTAFAKDINSDKYYYPVELELNTDSSLNLYGDDLYDLTEEQVEKMAGFEIIIPLKQSEHDFLFQGVLGSDDFVECTVLGSFEKDEKTHYKVHASVGLEDGSSCTFEAKTLDGKSTSFEIYAVGT